MLKHDTIEAFSVRVYAVIINDKDEVLLGEEYHFDQFMCKFPGGGLEFGEGTVDCLKREAIEEMGQELEVHEHIYTTDYFQPVYVRPSRQLISIYYTAKLKGEPKFPLNSRPFESTKAQNGEVTFRWQPIASLTEDMITFQTDKIVAKLIMERYKEKVSGPQLMR